MSEKRSRCKTNGAVARQAMPPRTLSSFGKDRNSRSDRPSFFLQFFALRELFRYDAQPRRPLSQLPSRVDLGDPFN
jgi:hypothetical protein